MVHKVFLDANVLVDLVLHRSRYQSAKELYHCIETGRIRGFTSPSIIHIVAYWTKKSQYAPGVKDVLIELCRNTKVVNVGHEITMQALQSKVKDVEDALRYYAAMAYEMDTFISNDRDLKKDASLILPVLNPNEFLRNFTGEE